MTQKQALMYTLEFAESTIEHDISKIKAARAFCILTWLEDMNWHSEMSSLLERVRSADYLNSAFKSIESDLRLTTKLDYIARHLNYIFGWGMKKEEWSSTSGPVLIEELWGIINFRQ